MKNAALQQNDLIAIDDIHRRYGWRIAFRRQFIEDTYQIAAELPKNDAHYEMKLARNFGRFCSCS